MIKLLGFVARRDSGLKKSVEEGKNQAFGQLSKKVLRGSYRIKYYLKYLSVVSNLFLCIP